MNLFIQYLFKDPQFFFTWLVFVVFSICCHEFMHAYAALKQGDSTAADAGHLTLNPLRQMGTFSLIMLAVAGIAWGAVPVRPYLMRHRHSDALVAFAGPATNFGLFLIFGILCFLVTKFTENEFAANMLWLGSLLNIVLFLLNLLPIPVLDGGHIVLALLEIIFRRPMPQKILEPITIGFVVLLVSFMLFVSFYDVKKLATPLIRSMEKDGEQKTENVEQESQNVNVKAEPVKAN